MKKNEGEILYCLEFQEFPVDGSMIADEMLSAIEVDFSSFFDRESGTLRYTVYSATPEEREAAKEKIVQALEFWNEAGLSISEITASDLEKSRWAESWKAFFKPLELSDRLMIRPSWYNDPLKEGQQLMVLDPGLSFGTGQHPTTLYCLQQIDRIAAQTDARTLSMLDAGCGTGILAIAAAKLGFGDIEAFDFDPAAVEVACENVQINNVSEKVAPFVADAGRYRGKGEKYDLVCANLLAHLLILFAKNISSWVKPGGTLVLAGILNEEFDKVSRVYSALGFTEAGRNSLKEWTSGYFILPEN
jgi:ribosomal protein L11 methyltransferase